jgi:hypothetical protein
MRKKLPPKIKKATPEEIREKARWARIKRVYGLTPKDYEKIDLGYCPICLREWSETVHPVIDHLHGENLVRGVVCRYCNHRRIGRHKDSEMMYRIAKYLEGPFSLKMPIKKRVRKTRKVR